MPALTAVAVFALAGCGGNDDNGAATAPSSAPVKTSTAPVADPVPSPDAAQTKALVTALGNIKPELAADEERAVRRARNVCQDIKAGKDAATMASNANSRFSGGTAGQLTDDQGAKIVEAVKSSFCK
ncbi:hypothetical protein QQY24_15815 [Streptomyces sp. TG1A-8]|uniref:DUF732 domain-containing protein n=1 Tax=Streptomyces sp. TG1A-8 TaxID=3051385 RepID=UPI00265BB938|nr:DUF732 domain-containing protein [Streptomyces sp. TG1A-8]MDO0926813.1 hypothetical protein [Streptomyces sp. TG1A-8]